MTFISMSEKFFPKPRPVIPPTRGPLPTKMPVKCKKAIRNRVPAINRALHEIDPDTIVDPMSKIAAEVCRKHNIGIAEVAAHDRLPHLVRARAEVYWRCRHELSKSFPEIGRHFNRDHTSVLYLIRKFQALLDSGEATL